MNDSPSATRRTPAPAVRAARCGKPQPSSDTRRFEPWIAALYIWLAAGCAACVLIPAARGFDAMVGWLPFWLVVAPVLDLLVLRRARLAREAAAWLQRATRRRRWRHQARRLQQHALRRRRPTPADAGART